MKKYKVIKKDLKGYIELLSPDSIATLNLSDTYNIETLCTGEYPSCPECGGHGGRFTEEHDFEVCDVCNGKGEF